MNFKSMKHRLRRFAKARDWEQFHSPKNLAMALAAEVGELLECFQWLTEAQSQALDRRSLRKVSDEIADIQIYLIRLADRLDLDLRAAVDRKFRKNQRKYPAHKVRGSARKYTEY